MDMNKVVRIGKVGGIGNVFCGIKLTKGRLSISGVEGPLKSGNCRGGCGQIGMSMDDAYLSAMQYAPGWDRGKADKFLEVWRKWHLNDMQAGCEHQRAAGWRACRGHYDPRGMETCVTPIEPADTESITKAVTEARQTGVGLVRGPGQHYYCSEDKCGKPCEVCGYRYGSAWLRAEIPIDVIEFLNELPKSDIVPAWV